MLKRANRDLKSLSFIYSTSNPSGSLSKAIATIFSECEMLKHKLEFLNFGFSFSTIISVF